MLKILLLEEGGRLSIVKHRRLTLNTFDGAQPNTYYTAVIYTHTHTDTLVELPTHVEALKSSRLLYHR